MEPIIDKEDDRTQEAVEQTKHEYNSIAAQYSKMNRHASAEHVELLLAALPRGVEEQRRRTDAEARIPELQKRVEFLEDAGVNDEDDEDLVEARTALATARRDAHRRVVDLGCGAGRDFPAFQERNIDYLGVDASEGMLTVARERFPEAAFEAQDLCALELPERSFDGAFANASLQHVPTPALPNALTNIYACLRPGGVLLISAPLGSAVHLFLLLVPVHWTSPLAQSGSPPRSLLVSLCPAPFFSFYVTRVARRRRPRW